MATHRELSYQQHTIHKQPPPDTTILHVLYYLLPIPLTTNLASFTTLLKTGMICHQTFMMLQP